MARCNRRGFTLLELLLALGLSVLVMSIIVGLVGMYSSNFTTRGEDIRRVALARAILNMIADDLRATVTKQEYDTKVLEQMLVGQGGGNPGGGGAGGGQSGGQMGGGQMSGGGNGGGGNGRSDGQNGGGPNNGGNDGRGNNAGGAGGGRTGGNTGQNNNQNTGAQSGAGAANNQNNRGNNNQRGGGGFGGQGQSGQGGQGSQNNRGQSGLGGGGAMAGGMSGQAGQSGNQNQSGQQNGQQDAADGTNPDATATQTLPLGVYGSATNLTIDISRIPRLDEYNAQQNAMLNGTLTDLPGDIKSVSYFVQMPTTIGVTDSMNQVTSTQTNTNGVAGLVRRALDRAVLDNAESMGQADQVNRTGELVAPEVLALEFSYYDGTQWTTTWDSSSQGLPWLVDINLAMQSKTGEKSGAIPPGISLSTMPYEERQRYGIEIYNLTVTIPGAQLQSTGTASGASGTGADSGMSSVGL